LLELLKQGSSLKRATNRANRWTYQRRGGNQVMRECACEIVNNYLTLCDEHKQELERLKANPPAWAIRARKGEGRR
jgi:hypothetical protein